MTEYSSLSADLAQTIEDIAYGRATRQAFVLRHTMALCCCDRQKRAIKHFIGGWPTAEDQKILLQMASDIRDIDQEITNGIRVHSEND